MVFGSIRCCVARAHGRYQRLKRWGLSAIRRIAQGSEGFFAVRILPTYNRVMPRIPLMQYTKLVRNYSAHRLSTLGIGVAVYRKMRAAKMHPAIGALAPAGFPAIELLSVGLKKRPPTLRQSAVRSPLLPRHKVLKRKRRLTRGWKRTQAPIGAAVFSIQNAEAPRVA